MVTAFELSLRHLDAVVAVAKNGSISAASSAVDLSQPALTQALAKLEGLLGQRLFHRQSRGVVPTTAGELFVARVERAVERIKLAGRSFPRAERLTPIVHLQRMASMGQLRAMSAVERAGSYALAARDLGVSQPSVHRAVRELELVLGVPLFVRDGRVVRAKPETAQLVAAVRLMATELQAGLDELEALKIDGAGKVVIGALQLPAAALLPEALARFARSHPQAVIRVVEGPYRELLSELRRGEIDLVLGALRNPLPSDELVQAQLFTDVLHIVARTGHPLVRDLAPSSMAMAGFPWVVSAKGAPTRRAWEELFADIDTELVFVECNSILATRGLLLGDDWLALMSPEQFRVEQQAGLLTTLGPELPGSRRPIGMITRKDWQPTATQEALIEHLRLAGLARR